jgi:hypothetical protein
MSALDTWTRGSHTFDAAGQGLSVNAAASSVAH